MKKIFSDRICLTDILLWIIDLGLLEIGLYDSKSFVYRFFVMLSLLFLIYIIWKNYKWFYKNRMQLKGTKLLYVIFRSELLELISFFLILEIKNDIGRIYVISFAYSVLTIFILVLQNIVFRIYLSISEAKSDFLFETKVSTYQKIIFIRNKIYQQTGLKLANSYFSLNNFDYFKKLACHISKNISKVDIEEYNLLLTMSDNSFNKWDWRKLFSSIIENGIAGIISMVLFGSLAIQIANVSLPSISINKSFNSLAYVLICLALMVIIIIFPVMRVNFKHRKIAKQKSFFIALFELALVCKE